MAKKKYTVSYACGSYSWVEDFNRLDEFEDIIDKARENIYAKVAVYDSSIREFIFWKNALDYKPSVDDLSRFDRDYRTKTRSWK